MMTHILFCFVAAITIQVRYGNGIFIHFTSALSLLFLNGRTLVMDIILLNKRFCSFFGYLSVKPAEDSSSIDVEYTRYTVYTIHVYFKWIQWRVSQVMRTHYI